MGPVNNKWKNGWHSTASSEEFSFVSSLLLELKAKIIFISVWDNSHDSTAKISKLEQMEYLSNASDPSWYKAVIYQRIDDFAYDFLARWFLYSGSNGQMTEWNRSRHVVKEYQKLKAWGYGLSISWKSLWEPRLTFCQEYFKDAFCHSKYLTECSWCHIFNFFQEASIPKRKILLSIRVIIISRTDLQK